MATERRAAASIEELFRKQAARDRAVRNAYLLVDAEARGLHLELAEGETAGQPADPAQPSYMASVGKLFTAALVGMLHDEGAVSLDDPITEHLDRELTDGLHVADGEDHTGKIQVKHLLAQTSGLPDDFEPLLERLLQSPDPGLTPRGAVLWAKENRTPLFPPGEGFHYTDTNYHLLGFIVERATGLAFYEALRQRIFEPLGMTRSSMLGFSEPAEAAPEPTADAYIRGTRVNDLAGYAALDYAGGGVVAPMGDLLTFMKALVSHRIVTAATLERMRSDSRKKHLGIRYGYGIWEIVPVPVIMPARLSCWGVLGITGAFMFYHPRLEAHFIGTFNDSAWEQKAVRFLMRLITVVDKG